MSRRFLTTALGDLLILALLAVSGEAAVRLFYPGASRCLFSPTVTGGHPITCNSHGLRDEEFPAVKPAGERRVLCLGDSSTFGAGISAGETYPKELERILNSGPSAGRWRVINAGGQGASVSELVRFLEEKGLGFKPEVVTLGFSPTMVSVAGRGGIEGSSPGAVPFPGSEAVSRAFRRALLSMHIRLHSSYLYVLLDASLRRPLYRWGIVRDRMDAREGALFAYAFDVPGVRQEEVESSYKTLGSELERCRDLLSSRGIPLVVVGLPSRFRISGARVDNERGYDLRKIRVEPLERMAGICGRMGLPFVDLQERLREERRRMTAGERPWDDLYIPGDYAHLNPTGMRTAAEELAAAVREKALQSEAGP